MVTAIPRTNFFILQPELRCLVYSHIPNVCKHTTMTLQPNTSSSSTITIVHVVPTTTIRASNRLIAGEWNQQRIRQCLSSIREVEETSWPDGPLKLIMELNALPLLAIETSWLLKACRWSQMLSSHDENITVNDFIQRENIAS
jgi:hypothetical protein